MVLHPDPVAEQRPAGERRGRVDRQHADPLAPARAAPRPARGRRRLADPGRAGEPDDLGRAGVRRERRPSTSRSCGDVVLDQRDQPGHRARRRPPRARSTQRPGPTSRGTPGRGHPRRHARDAAASSASPWPPPPHSAAAPMPPPRRCSSSARCSTIRAPDIPIGWPSAIAPPLTLTLSGVDAELAHRLDADRRERLVDLDQVEVGDARGPPCRSAVRDRVGRLRAAASVRAGDLAVRRRSRPATVSPSSSALALLITTTAQAPSEICEAEPAVIVPSGLNAGRSLASDSAVVSPRMPSSSRTTTGSPLRCGISHRHDLVVEQRRSSARRRPAGASGRRTRPAPRGSCRAGRCSRRSTRPSGRGRRRRYSAVVAPSSRRSSTVAVLEALARRRAAGAARWSSTPCRRPRRSRTRRPGSAGRPARWRPARTGRPC